MTTLQKDYCNIVLPNFIAKNPHAKVALEKDDILVIDNPWGREDARLKVATADHAFMADLNQLVFDPKYDAIFHLDSNQMEVAFGYLNPKDETYGPLIGRKFCFHFEGEKFTCEFAVPTERFMRLAKHYERLPTDDRGGTIPQLVIFRDAQRVESLTEGQKKYFSGKTPCNFFIVSPNGFMRTSVEKLARHVNFLLFYYDRLSPVIEIRQVSSKANEHSPVRMIEDKFPDSCLITEPIDDIVLKLLDVAHGSVARFAFIYYYQVFEYLGYYYIDGRARSALRNAFRDPSIICGGEAKLDELFSIFSDLNQNDEAKMRKVIEEYCDPRIIWKEVNHDRDFFSEEQSFDGGFVAPPLLGKDISEDSWKTMWMPKTFDLLTKIRNVLVHAREKRESKVILPSRRNNEILERYIPVIRRIAEQLAIKA